MKLKAFIKLLRVYNISTDIKSRYRLYSISKTIDMEMDRQHFIRNLFVVAFYSFFAPTATFCNSTLYNQEIPFNRSTERILGIYILCVYLLSYRFRILNKPKGWNLNIEMDCEISKELSSCHFWFMEFIPRTKKVINNAFTTIYYPYWSIIRL